MLWSHTVCWTDRAIRRHVFGGNLVSTPLRIRPLREWGKAKLRFEYNRHIGINVGDISWLEPEAGGERTRLVKTISLPAATSVAGLGCAMAGWATAASSAAAKVRTKRVRALMMRSR